MDDVDDIVGLTIFGMLCLFLILMFVGAIKIILA